MSRQPRGPIAREQAAGARGPGGPSELVLIPDAGLSATTLAALAVDPSDTSVSIQFALCSEITSTPSPTLPCPGTAGIELPDAGPLSALLDLADPRIAAFASQARLDGGAFDACSGIEQQLDQGVSLLVGFSARAGAATWVEWTAPDVALAGSRALLGRAPGNRRRDNLDRAVCRHDP